MYYFINLIPIILIALIFYFVIIRTDRNMEIIRYDAVNALKGGERVITQTGLIGTLVERDGAIFKIKLAEGFTIECLQSGIKDIILSNELNNIPLADNELANAYDSDNKWSEVS